MEKPNPEEYTFTRQVGFDDTESYFDFELYQSDLAKWNLSQQNTKIKEEAVTTTNEFELCEMFLKNQINLTTFKPKEIEFLKLAFEGGARIMYNVMQNRLKNNIPLDNDIEAVEKCCCLPVCTCNKNTECYGNKKCRLDDVEEYAEKYKNEKDKIVDDLNKRLYDCSVQNAKLMANQLKNDVTDEDKECKSGKSYGDCHIHSQNLNGCVDCGNYELKN